MAAINSDERYLRRLCSLDICRKTLPQYSNTADSSQVLSKVHAVDTQGQSDFNFPHRPEV